jgi:hypothetical protein
MLKTYCIVGYVSQLKAIIISLKDYVLYESQSDEESRKFCCDSLRYFETRIRPQNKWSP